jgi:2Fe-2S ferredoxin
MQAAVNQGIDGIIGDCGGACACATCHCYIDATWAGRLPAPQAGERAMLDCVIDPTEHSRLACQVKVTDELDGMVVRLPAAQY